MKNRLLLFFFCALSFSGIAENLIFNAGFSDNLRGFKAGPDARYEEKDNVLEIRGNPESKLNSALYLEGRLKVAPGQCSDRDMVLAFEAKVGPLSGALQVAVREQAGPAFATLHQIRVKKWDAHSGWKKYSLRFKCHSGVSEMKVVFRAFYLEAEDWIQLRNLSLTFAGTEKRTK